SSSQSCPGRRSTRSPGLGCADGRGSCSPRRIRRRIMTVHTEDPPVSPATGRPLTSRGQQTRRRLLEAAEQVFADLGYHEASIVKITEHAGVALGTFYLYFDSKQSIFEALVLDLNSRV